MASTLEIMKGLKFQNKKAAGFGSYGWSGESPKLMTEALKDCGFEVIEEDLGVLWQPDEEALEKCRAYGVSLAQKL
jgi:flavorubredoxin